VIVASTGGSVMNEVLKNAFFRSQIFAVVSDRDCSAIEKARRHGVTTEIIAERSKEVFCDRLLDYLGNHQIDYVISFFTKLFVGDLLKHYRDRIINLHLSLLPAFKGLDGFRDTVNYGVRYIGTTIHFIDENMDEGKIILQTVYPLDANKEEAVLRHRLFQQQCKSLLQVMKWLVDGRIKVQDNRVIVENATFADYEFSPNLDFQDAVQLEIPLVIKST
jgi:phosphoribosylglycinamide formyltransferase-1